MRMEEITYDDLTVIWECEENAPDGACIDIEAICMEVGYEERRD